MKFLIAAVATLLASMLLPLTASVQIPGEAFATISAAVKLPYGVRIFFAIYS
jgi:hypothetical protein